MFQIIFRKPSFAHVTIWIQTLSFSVVVSKPLQFSYDIVPDIQRVLYNNNTTLEVIRCNERTLQMRKR